MRNLIDLNNASDDIRNKSVATVAAAIIYERHKCRQPWAQLIEFVLSFLKPNANKYLL